jgi:integrase
MQLHVYLLLNKIFKDAVEEYELIPNNPVRLKYRPKLQKRERPFLNPKDSWKLLNEVGPHWLGPAIWICLLAGLRPCEIQALTWDCIDFENKKILIRKSYKRKVNRIEPSTKQGDWAEAPIPEPLEKYLLTLKADGRAKSEFVAPGKFGGMLKYNILLNGLKRLCKKAEVKIITPHELRHSCSELYVQEGASAEDIRRLLNHSSLNVTQRYIHRTNERLDGIASKVQNVKPESPDRTTPPSRPNLRLIS